MITEGAQVEPSPSQTPHSSKTAGPFGTPAQSAQLDPSPSHTPHSSKTAGHSKHRRSRHSWTHHRRTHAGIQNRGTIGTPAQSAQLEPSPSQTPHSSRTAAPLHRDSQHSWSHHLHRRRKRQGQHRHWNTGAVGAAGAITVAHTACINQCVAIWDTGAISTAGGRHRTHRRHRLLHHR